MEIKGDYFFTIYQLMDGSYEARIKFPFGQNDSVANGKNKDEIFESIIVSVMDRMKVRMGFWGRMWDKVANLHSRFSKKKEEKYEDNINQKYLDKYS